MFFLSPICCLCLSEEGEIKCLNKDDKHDEELLSKINSCAFETEWVETGSLLFICYKCHCTVNILHDFKKSCLKNSNIMRRYISQLKFVGENQSKRFLTRSEIDKSYTKVIEEFKAAVKCAGNIENVTASLSKLYALKSPNCDQRTSFSSLKESDISSGEKRDRGDENGDSGDLNQTGSQKRSRTDVNKGITCEQQRKVSAVFANFEELSRSASKESSSKTPENPRFDSSNISNSKDAAIVKQGAPDEDAAIVKQGTPDKDAAVAKQEAPDEDATIVKQETPDENTADPCTVTTPELKVKGKEASGITSAAPSGSVKTVLGVENSALVKNYEVKEEDRDDFLNFDNDVLENLPDMYFQAISISYPAPKTTDSQTESKDSASEAVVSKLKDSAARRADLTTENSTAQKKSSSSLKPADLNTEKANVGRRTRQSSSSLSSKLPDVNAGRADSAAGNPILETSRVRTEEFSRSVKDHDSSAKFTDSNTRTDLAGRNKESSGDSIAGLRNSSSSVENYGSSLNRVDSTEKIEDSSSTVEKDGSFSRETCSNVKKARTKALLNSTVEKIDPLNSDAGKVESATKGIDSAAGTKHSSGSVEIEGSNPKRGDLAAKKITKNSVTRTDDFSYSMKNNSSSSRWISSNARRKDSSEVAQNSDSSLKLVSNAKSIGSTPGNLKRNSAAASKVKDDGSSSRLRNSTSEGAELTAESSVSSSRLQDNSSSKLQASRADLSAGSKVPSSAIESSNVRTTKAAEYITSNRGHSLTRTEDFPGAVENSASVSKLPHKNANRIDSASKNLTSKPTGSAAGNSCRTAEGSTAKRAGLKNSSREVRDNDLVQKIGTNTAKSDSAPKNTTSRRSSSNSVEDGGSAARNKDSSRGGQSFSGTDSASRTTRKSDSVSRNTASRRRADSSSSSVEDGVSAARNKDSSRIDPSVSEADSASRNTTTRSGRSSSSSTSIEDGGSAARNKDPSRVDQSVSGTDSESRNITARTGRADRSSISVEDGASIAKNKDSSKAGQSGSGVDSASRNTTVRTGRTDKSFSSVEDGASTARTKDSSKTGQNVSASKNTDSRSGRTDSSSSFIEDSASAAVTKHSSKAGQNVSGADSASRNATARRGRTSSSSSSVEDGGSAAGNKDSSGATDCVSSSGNPASKKTVVGSSSNSAEDNASSSSKRAGSSEKTPSRRGADSQKRQVSHSLEEVDSATKKVRPLDSSESFECSNCQKKFDTYSELYNHEYDFMCSFCSLTFCNELEQVRHENKHRDFIECPICMKHIELNRGGLLHGFGRHVLQHAKNNFCPVCYRKINSFNQLLKHVAYSHQDDATYCRNCKREFSTKIKLINHVENTHVYACEQCRKTFRARKQLDDHVQTHQVSCNLCSAKFANVTEFNRHVINQHDDGSFLPFTT